ncbi:MAG: hypothetical protein AB1938_00630 [Myxococcota bacterium]
MELFQATQAFDIRHYEEAAPAAVFMGLTIPVRGLVERALEKIESVLTHYDGASDAAPPSDPLNFELALDQTLHAHGGPAKVADLAFMARVELRQRHGRLVTHAPTGEAWEMVCDCGSALRRVRKSMGAIEFALCELECVPRRLRYDSELEVSLAVRRQYRKLWSFTAGQGEVGPVGARAALRGAGTLIAMLVGRDEYCQLREGDRLQLRALQRRILAWLGRGDAEPREGYRLWEDFSAFTSMLRLVNLRQELREHDLEALRIARRAWAGEGDRQGALAVLQRLVGLDDELDGALLEVPPAITRIGAAVHRLWDQLSASPPPQATKGDAF